MPVPEFPPIGWFLLLAALPVLSLLALLHLRRSEGSSWLRWDQVPCPPWQFSDILLLGFLASASVFLLYPVTPVIVILGAIWLAQARHFDLLSVWKLNRAHLRFSEGIFLYLACLLPIGALALFSTALSDRLGLDNLLQGPVQKILETSDLNKLLFLLVAAIFIAPLWEEAVFRGVLYPFCKSRIGRWPALLFTGLFFAAIHAHLPSLLPLTLLGIMLGLAYERSGSLWSPILLHTFFNLGTSTNLLLLRLHATS